MRVDTHLHVYADPAQGLAEVENLPIVEYGDKADVPLAGVGGSVVEALETLNTAAYDYGVVLGSYEVPGYPDPPKIGGHWPSVPAYPQHRDDLVAYNRWVCQLGVDHPQLIPFVTANPAVMSGDDAREHLAEAFGDWGARGLKIHPIGIRTHVEDPGMEGVYDACEAAGMPIVFHSGPDVRALGFSEPERFGPLARRRPGLKLILAHLGGGSWRSTLALADEHPQLMFDLTEIAMWIGATGGPTAEDLVALIRGVGVGRIVTGSDFPWYTPAMHAEIIASLPGLSAGEVDALLGDNAARILQLNG